MKIKHIYFLNIAFIGIQIAYALQSANLSRVFLLYGVSPLDIAYFWIIPPLMGAIVQPIFGRLSDRVNTKFGKRMPFLLGGTLITVFVFLSIPFLSKLGISNMGVVLAALILIILETSLNIAMQSIKTLVADLVPNEQSQYAFSIQAALCNIGSFIGYGLPIIFTFIGVRNSTVDDAIGLPDSVNYSFVFGAVAIVLSATVTMVTIKEPKSVVHQETENLSIVVRKLCTNSIFVKISIIQFFCWAAFLYMWTYSTGAVAEKIWNERVVQSVNYQNAANWIGIMYIVQAVGAIVWAYVISQIKSAKRAYTLSVLFGAIGFLSMPFILNKYLVLLPYFVIGFTWAAMTSLPYSLLKKHVLEKNENGFGLGLFNVTICLPQIVAAVFGGGILGLFGGNQMMMLVLSGVLLLIGTLLLFIFKLE